MKMVFICGSLESGKDGVGDYSYKVASGLTEKGHISCLLSFNDKYIQEPVEEVRQTRIPILRLPSAQPVQERTEEAAQWIEQQAPDVISIQYVPYGFQKRGMPFWLPAVIKRISGGKRVHIMFHELWQGEAAQSNLKEKATGFLQKQVSKRLFAVSGFAQAFTNTEFYGSCLSREGIDNAVVPVFSNLPPASGGVELYEKLPAEIKERRDDYLIACLFGAVHFDEGLGDKVSKLKAMVDRLSKKLFVVHTGKANFAPGFTDVFASRQIGFMAMGEQPAQAVSDFFAIADLGLSTHPKILYQKSGSMAAMLNNGLPVVILRDGFMKDDRKIDEVKEVEEIDSLYDFVHQPKTFAQRYNADDTIQYYLSLLT